MTFIPREVEQEMNDLFDELAIAVVEYRDLVEKAAEAESTYKVAFATAMLTAKKAADKVSLGEADAEATVATAQEGRVYRVYDARERAQKEVLTTLRARLDGLRSVAANLRDREFAR